MKAAIISAATVVLLAIALATTLVWLNPAEVTPVSRKRNSDISEPDIFNPIFLGP